MAALGWRISEPERLVAVRGVGLFDFAFISSFREAMRAHGAAVGYRKLFDLSRADIDLSNEDMQTMVASTRLTAAMTAGPIAIVLGRTPPPLLVDMAVLLKDRIGSRRRLRLFTDETLARQWLFSEVVTARPSDEVLPSPVRAQNVGFVR